MSVLSNGSQAPRTGNEKEESVPMPTEKEDVPVYYVVSLLRNV